MSQPEWEVLVEEVRELRTRVARMELAMGRCAGRCNHRSACHGIAAGAGDSGIPHVAPAGAWTRAARPGRRVPAARANRSGYLHAPYGSCHRSGLRHAVAGLGGAHTTGTPPGNHTARADERVGAFPSALRGHRAFPRNLRLDSGGDSADVHPVRPRRILAQGPADCGYLRHAGGARYRALSCSCLRGTSCRSLS